MRLVCGFESLTLRELKNPANPRKSSVFKGSRDFCISQSVHIWTLKSHILTVMVTNLVTNF